MLEQHRFCHDHGHATGAQEFRRGDQQVDGEDEEVAHRANGIITISTCKTAHRGWIASHYEFAPHTFLVFKIWAEGMQPLEVAIATTAAAVDGSYGIPFLRAQGVAWANGLATASKA
jgi:hypothetical protein